MYINDDWSQTGAEGRRPLSPGRHAGRSDFIGRVGRTGLLALLRAAEEHVGTGQAVAAKLWELAEAARLMAEMSGGGGDGDGR